MKYIIGKHTLPLLLTVALVLLTGCQSDGGDSPRQIPTMEMQACATTYKDATPKASTRDGEAWAPPSGFTLYTGHDDISVAFTQGNSIAKGAKENETDPDRDAKGVFRFQDDIWKSNFPLPSAGDYYLYGYMPSVGNLSLAPVNSGYADGATLTISGLPTATSSDVCVIVGVSKGSSPTVDGGITMGQFGYTINADKNYVFLLCDHLYAALRLSIKVNETYNALRRIKLKKVWVKDCKNSTQTFTSKSNVVINLLSNTTGASPIQSITFTNDGTNTVLDMEQNPLFVSDEGLLLTASYQNVQGCMAPIGMTDFTLVSQYDVYDTNGNLIRQNQTAANKINISSLFTATTSFQRGTRYTLYLTVNPTYLYMLSEPDLDNPTVEVGS